DAVHRGHPHVHQDDIGGRTSQPVDRLASICRLQHYLQVGLRRDEHRKAGPNQLLVVDERHPDRPFHEVAHGTAAPSPVAHEASVLPRGRSASTSNPPSVLVRVCRVPPCRSTRSLMPRRPRPLPSRPGQPDGPWPSSETTTRARWLSYCTRTTTLADGPACRITLVRASCTIR